ncbi:MAG: FAD-dependent monooxygenase [Candidatus Rokubacteria bacterium]|nr:FAD-dependent monooxygenase [Candidatus Rokubacteria bacterium]
MIIAGAGPVGLALAVGLAHHGVRSVVLEESPRLSEHSKAPGILSRTLEIFSAWGILDRFLSRGTLLRRPELWTPGRDTPLLTIDLSPLGGMTIVPGMLILPQNRTEEILFDVASASGLVDVRFGHRVTSFTEDGSGVTVSAVTTDDAAVEVRGAYLVGCDGPHSAVRDALGFELEGKTYPARLLLADVRPGDARDTLPWPRLAARGDGVLGGIRIETGLWRLIATVESRVTDEQATSRPHVASLVTTLLGPGPFELVWASTFRIHCRTSPRFRRGRVLLAGDAAHINSPAGGQGMNSGIHDAHNLAWKLARVLAGGHAEPLLASYEAERRPAILTNVDRYTDLLTRTVLLAPRVVRLAMLGVARLALGRSLTTTHVLRRAGMLDTKYDASPLISGRGRWLGARAPDARLGADNATVRLHGLAARDAAVLLFDDGRLPGWNVADVEHSLRGVSGVRVARLVASAGDATRTDFVDLDGTVWRDWAPRPGTAALVRPDAHVGWMAERPTRDALVAGVRRALGAD